MPTFVVASLVKTSVKIETSISVEYSVIRGGLLACQDFTLARQFRIHTFELYPRLALPVIGELGHQIETGFHTNQTEKCCHHGSESGKPSPSEHDQGGP